jgi:hypothetical protein
MRINVMMDELQALEWRSRTGVDIGHRIGGFGEDVALDESAVTRIDVMCFSHIQRSLRATATDQVTIVRPLTRVPNHLQVIDNCVNIFGVDGRKPITCQLTENIGRTRACPIILKSGPDAEKAQPLL